jgi:hypothetical protein
MSLDSLLDSLLAVPPVPQSNTAREPLKAIDNKASSRSSPGSLIISSLLNNAIVAAVGDLPIAADEIRAALDKDDIENWNESKTSTKSLVSKAIIALARSEINQGSIPANFTKRAMCGLCGPVWLWFEGNVAGCPWCVNRINDLPIPRPWAVCCGDCKHFKRIAHPHLGHCARGEPEAVAGLWDSDHRHCFRWLPKKETGDYQDDK